MKFKLDFFHIQPSGGLILIMNREKKKQVKLTLPVKLDATSKLETKLKIEV